MALKRSYRNGLDELFDKDIFKLVHTLQRVWSDTKGEGHAAEWASLVSAVGCLPKVDENNYEALQKLLINLIPDTTVGKLLSTETSFQRKDSADVIDWALVLMAPICWSIARQTVGLAGLSPEGVFEPFPSAHHTIATSKQFADSLKNTKGYEYLSSFVFMCEKKLDGSSSEEFPVSNHFHSDAKPKVRE